MAFIEPFAGAHQAAQAAISTTTLYPLATTFPIAVTTGLVGMDSMSEVATRLLRSVGEEPTPDLGTVVSTLALVTASDMIPFVPCQPLAITLGATFGLWAFPICVLGQCLAGVLAFQSARSAADAQGVQKALDDLGSDEAREKFLQFRKMGTAEGEGTVFLALVGLRLAPFFPFSAGNYLLGGATGVGLRPFILATLLGCLLSNFVSVSIGMGGMELWLQSP